MTDYTTIEDREVFTKVDTYDMCDIYKGSKGGFALSTEIHKRFPRKFATLSLARTAVTKRYTAVNNVYARNYLKQN